jgi:hypothetical protein
MTVLASTSELQKPSSSTLSWGVLIVCFALALLVLPTPATAGNWNVAVGVSGGNGYRPIGMQRGVLGGDIPLIQLATHTRLARHLQCMCNPFWLSPLCWQHNPNPQSGIFVHPPRSIFQM